MLAVNTKIDHDTIDENLKTKGMMSADSLRTYLNARSAAEDPAVISRIVREIDKEFVVTHRDSAESSGPKFTFGGEDPGDSKFKQYINKKGRYLTSLGRQGLSLFLKEIINQVPRIFFLLLPVFALCLKLLYVRHSIYFIEHFVFSLHFHTFIFLFMIVPVFFSNFWVIFSIFCLIQIYLFIAMKRFYGQSIGKTLLKTFLVLFLYSFSFLPAVLILLLMAVISV